MAQSRSSGACTSLQEHSWLPLDTPKKEKFIPAFILHKKLCITDELESYLLKASQLVDGLYQKSPAYEVLPELLGGAGESVLLVDGDNHMGWEGEGHSSKHTFSVLALKDNIS